jgi:hypothetical protein
MQVFKIYSLKFQFYHAALLAKDRVESFGLTMSLAQYWNVMPQHNYLLITGSAQVCMKK